MSYTNYNYYSPYQQNGYLNNPMSVPQQLYNNNNVSNGLKGHPVSSYEEVRAAQVDFDGSLFVYPDIANNRVYTKRITMDGTSELKIYELLKDAPIKTVSEEDFVRKEDMEKLREELLALIKEPKEKEKSTASVVSF